MDPFSVAETLHILNIKYKIYKYNIDVWIKVTMYSVILYMLRLKKQLRNVVLIN